ncbi:MAG TPA: type II toxin-antitoxin system HicB family antitoxin [Terriglobales bacterium]|nr:type II toxin-antitoxin system HicB family antitoxin [Terriglobales bacterium]
MSGYRFSVLVAKDIKGWEARCPDFPDWRARGSSFEDAVDNLKELVRVLVEDGLGDDEHVLDDGGLSDDGTIPQPDELCFKALTI